MMYKDYLEKNHSFDKKTMLGIFCMIIVIGGVFGFLYEYFFYFFNGGMKEFYYREFSPLDKYICDRFSYDIYSYI